VNKRSTSAGSAATVVVDADAGAATTPSSTASSASTSVPPPRAPNVVSCGAPAAIHQRRISICAGVGGVFPSAGMKASSSLGSVMR